jgi:hypothetical protein
VLCKGATTAAAVEAERADEISASYFNFNAASFPVEKTKVNKLIKRTQIYRLRRHEG